MNIRKIKISVGNSLHIGSLILSLALLTISCANAETAAEVKAETIEMEGSWSDGSDTIVITSSTRKTKAYLGSAPKTDYTGTIESFNNTNKTYIFSGKDLDYSAYPTITEKTNTVYDRTKWYKADANTFYICTESYGKTSLAQVNADTTSYTFNPANPTAANCGVGAWTKYTRTP